MPRAAHTLFELNSYQPLKKHFGVKYFVLPQACPSGPSHHIWGIFPSFFLKFEPNFFGDAFNKARNNRHGFKRLFVINPDYAVIKKENVLSIKSYKADNEFEGAIKIEDMDEIVSKNISECIVGKKNVHRPNIWFLSEEMKGDFDEYLKKYLILI